MAAHSMAAFNEDQFQELLALGTALSNEITSKVEAARDTFKRLIIDTDTILMEDDEYKEKCGEIVTTVGKIIEVSDMPNIIKEFQDGATQIAEQVGVTMRKNEENLEQALSAFNATVKKAGEEIGQ